MAKRTKSGAKPSAESDQDDVEGPLKLTAWLKAAGVKQAWLARETGFTPGYISQLCNPDDYPDNNPRFAALRTIAKALSSKMGYQVAVEELYEPPPSAREIARSRAMAERMASFDK